MDSAANDLLENGIYVETNRGLVCMSLKDALTSGVGGLKLSVEDLQNIAHLLTQHQESPSHSVPEESGPEQSGQSDTCVVEASSQETDSGKETDTCVAPPPSLVPQKKRGGWPKGRKRKPEALERPAPKAPVTGYVLFLNEHRKQYKNLSFSEVTKLLGSEWSRMSQKEKQKYFDQAEEDRKRYRRELKAYRQSSAYQEFLRKKRLKRYGNRTEESDMDATDEIEDDEDNEELYCRRCDQWFTSMHNKKEHLYGRTHMQAMTNIEASERRLKEARDLSSSTPLSTSLDESSLDGCPAPSSSYSSCSAVESSSSVVQQPPTVLPATSAGPSDVPTDVLNFFASCASREKEIKCLKSRLEESQAENTQLVRQLSQLREREISLRNQHDLEQEEASVLNAAQGILVGSDSAPYIPEPMPFEFCNIKAEPL